MGQKAAKRRNGRALDELGEEKRRESGATYSKSFDLLPSLLLFSALSKLLGPPDKK